MRAAGRWQGNGVGSQARAEYARNQSPRSHPDGPASESALTGTSSGGTGMWGGCTGAGAQHARPRTVTFADQTRFSALESQMAARSDELGRAQEGGGSGTTQGVSHRLSASTNSVRGLRGKIGADAATEREAYVGLRPPPPLTHSARAFLRTRDSAVPRTATPPCSGFHAYFDKASKALAARDADAPTISWRAAMRSPPRQPAFEERMRVGEVPPLPPVAWPTVTGVSPSPGSVRSPPCGPTTAGSPSDLTSGCAPRRKPAWTLLGAASLQAAVRRLGGTGLQVRR